MSKIVKISVTCPQCATKLAVPITEADEEVYLSDGDQFRLGDTMFRVSIAEQSLSSGELTI